MRLKEKPSEEELELLTYWVNAKGRPWPMDGDNVPLDIDTDKPLKMISDTGLPEKRASKDIPERIQIWIKMLQSRETNEITSAIMKTRASRQRIRTGSGRRRSVPVIDSDVDYNLAAKMRLRAGIVKWNGIETEDGKPAPISDKYLDLLPSWLQDDVVDRINELSTLPEEEVSE